MKYWNKDKKVRQQHWYAVPSGNWRPYADTKRELQLFDSPGRFYLYYGSSTIWFEREADALWWRLKS
jgi:hypothetical protein